MTTLESNYSNQVQASGTIIDGTVIQTVNQGSVELKWTALPKFFVDGEEYGTTGYELLEGEELLFEVEGAETSTHTLEELKEGIEKKVKLFAVDANAEPKESLELSDEFALRTRPSVPENLVANSEVGAIELTWDKVSQEDGKNATLTNYVIYRSTQDGTSYQKIGSVKAEDEAVFLDTDLHADTIYYYVVTSESVFE